MKNKFVLWTIFSLRFSVSLHCSRSEEKDCQEERRSDTTERIQFATNNLTPRQILLEQVGNKVAEQLEQASKSGKHYDATQLQILLASCIEELEEFPELNVARTEIITWQNTLKNEIKTNSNPNWCCTIS